MSAAVGSPRLVGGSPGASSGSSAGCSGATRRAAFFSFLLPLLLLALFGAVFAGRQKDLDVIVPGHRRA